MPTPCWVMSDDLQTSPETPSHLQHTDNQRLCTNGNTCKNIYTNEPAYLHALLKHVTSHSLRSSDSNLLSVPHVRTCFGSRSFAVAAPTIWNTLPLGIRNSPSICCFRHHLKTFFYNLVFRPLWSLPYPLRLRFSRVFPLTLSAIQIYLLTYPLNNMLKTYTVAACCMYRTQS